jgi:DNA-binding IscR family transcriptional regulator
MDGVRAAALQYHNLGLNVIPIKKGGKEPLVQYSQYTYRRQTENDIYSLFPDENLNVGIITGDCSRNLFILDFDSEAGYQTVLHNERFRRIVEHTTVVTSGRESGGRHILLRAHVPVRSTNNKELDLDVKGVGGYCVAPPSLHPTGKRYTAERTESIYLLHDLQELSFIRLEKAECRLDSPLSRLTVNDWSKLSDWLKKTQRGERSEAEQAAVVLLVSRGCDFHEVLDFFERNAGKESKFYEKGRYRYQYLRKGYENACRLVEATQDKARRLSEIADSDWVYMNRRTIGTDRAISHAIIDIALRTGKNEIGISVRELAELAGITVPTAQAGLKRSPFLERTETGPIIVRCATKNSARVYRITEPVPGQSNDIGHILNSPHILSPLRTVKEVSNFTPKFNHDAFRNTALGKTGARVLQYLSENRNAIFTTHTVSDGTGITRKTVQRKLVKLSEVGVLQTEGNGRGRKYILISDISEETLDMIAKAFGTFGAGETQRKEFQRQRAEHRMKQNITTWREIPYEDNRHGIAVDFSEVITKPLTE